MSTDVQALKAAHAAKRFDWNRLSSLARSVLKRTSLRAAADNTFPGVTVHEVDAALKAAGISGQDAIEAKVSLRSVGAMRNL